MRKELIFLFTLISSFSFGQIDSLSLSFTMPNGYSDSVKSVVLVLKKGAATLHSIRKDGTVDWKFVQHEMDRNDIYESCNILDYERSLNNFLRAFELHEEFFENKDNCERFASEYSSTLAQNYIDKERFVNNEYDLDLAKSLMFEESPSIQKYSYSINFFANGEILSKIHSSSWSFPLLFSRMTVNDEIVYLKNGAPIIRELIETSFLDSTSEFLSLELTKEEIIKRFMHAIYRTRAYR